MFLKILLVITSSYNLVLIWILKVQIFNSVFFFTLKYSLVFLDFRLVPLIKEFKIVITVY